MADASRSVRVKNSARFLRRIVVTGGCGFIGSALVRHLVGKRRIAVLNIDKLTYAGDPTTVAEVADNPLYSFAQIDICKPVELMRAFLRFGPDAVIHLAAETHVDRSLDGPGDFIETN